MSLETTVRDLPDEELLARERRAHLERVPPASIELEWCVLGGIMLEPREAYPLVAEILKPEYFYLTGSQLLFALMGELWARGLPPDAQLLSDEIAARNLEQQIPRGDLWSMLTQVPSAANVEMHARRVAEKACLRALLHACAATMDACYCQERSASELCAEISDAATLIGASGAPGVTLQVGELLEPYGDELEARMEEAERLFAAGEQHPWVAPGLRTYFDALDDMLCGLVPGQLVVLAARPSLGKTALALNIARNLALRDVPVGFVTLEQTADELSKRALVMGTRYWQGEQIRAVGTDRLNEARLNEAEKAALARSFAEMQHAPLLIEECLDSALEPVLACMRRLVQREHAQLLVVDYLQLIQGRGESLVHDTTVAITRLKAAARQLRVPLLLLSQLSRAGEKAGREPRLSDLRDSGAIEQAADVVVFVHRQGDMWPNLSSASETELRQSQGRLVVAKNRNGPCGFLPVFYFPPAMTFLPADTRR